VTLNYRLRDRRQSPRPSRVKKRLKKKDQRSCFSQKPRREKLVVQKQDEDYDRWNIQVVE